MDNGSQTSLMIESLPRGGYVVSDALGDRGIMRVSYIACTTIDEALKFIRDKIAPAPVSLTSSMAGVDIWGKP